MNQSPLHLITIRPERLLVVGTFLILLIAFFLATPGLGLADSGGFPTPTPTVTPIPTITPTWTPTPTATWTATPTITLVTVFTLTPTSTPDPALLAILTPQPTPIEDGGIGALACLPLAIIIILAVVIGATWLLTHRPTEEVIT